jgi:cell division septal protein FtsQ
MKKKKGASGKKRLVSVFAGVLFVIFFLWIYIATPFFQIYSYEVEGVKEPYRTKLISTISSFEQEPILGFLPGDTIISYHRKAIRRTVFEHLPDTKEVVIQTKGLHTVRIAVTPYEPFFRKGDTEGVTKDGIVYKVVEPLIGFPSLLFASSTLASPSMYQLLTYLSPKISKSIFPVSVIYVDENSDVYFKGGVAMSEVRVDGDSSSHKAWSTLVSAIDTEPLKGLLVTKKESLQYLDVRFGNKVFYKFTNTGGGSIIDQSHATTSSSTPSSR